MGKKSNLKGESLAESRVNLVTQPSNEKETEITIEVEAQGEENAFGFSLMFDPSKWSFIDARPGDEFGLAMLNVNERESDLGRVGLALALPAGQGVGPGRHNLLIVTFRGLLKDLKDVPITFSDMPVTREVVDVNANVLKSVFAVQAPISSALGVHVESPRLYTLTPHIPSFDRRAAGIEYWTWQVKHLWLKRRASL
jgi:hypothetical protein